MDWNLTRRRAFLGSLGTLGVGLAGGLSLSTEPARALEQTTNGENGLVLDWAATRNGQSDEGSVTDTGTAFTYTLANLLPGDFGTLTVEMSLTEGTADSVPRFAFDLTGKAENSWNDPERNAGDSTQTEGELQDYVDVKIFYDTGTLGVDMWGATNGEQDPGEGLIDPAADETLQAVADALPDAGANGIVLDADPTSPDDDPLTDQNSVAITFGWVFTGPTDINVTQTDSVTFDLIFTAEEVN